MNCVQDCTYVNTSITYSKYYAYSGTKKCVNNCGALSQYKYDGAATRSC
jgi:hypothetical protein